MKPNQEKILLEDLIGYYTPETIATYRNDAQFLASELKDLHTLTLLAQTQFSDIVVDVKKKSLDYDKTFKACDRPSKELAGIMVSFTNRSNSNYDFAYKIHSLQPVSNGQNSHKTLLTQLKLKFLQSEGVDEDKWSRWFSPEEKLLILSDKTGRYEIKITLQLEVSATPNLIWKVFKFSLDSRQHPLLLEFVNEYITWLRKENKDCQRVLLDKLDEILDNIEIVLLFLSLRVEIWRKGGQCRDEKMSIIHNKVGNIVFSWQFHLFKNIQNAKLQFFVNNEKYYELNFDKLFFKGKITLKHENLPQITLHASRPISILTNGYLYKLSCKLYKYSIRCTKFWQNYLYLQSATSLILNLCSILWISEKQMLSQEEISSINSQGLWGKINLQNSILYTIQQDLSLTYGQFQKGYFSYLLSKLSLQNTLLHLRLRKQISKYNREYEFKSYRVSYLQKEREMMYEFRSFKYSQHQKMFRLPKLEQQSMHLMNESNDNFVIICRIAHDFSKVSYSSYKFSEGQAQEKQITDNFLPKKWKQYKQTQTKPYNWGKVYECISYICKCYLVERSYNRRMTEQQRKFTTYSFK